MTSYLYRCTEQQLEPHLQRVADSGDVVEHVIFKGGRDYVLVCRKPDAPAVVTATLSVETLTALGAEITAAIERAHRKNVRAAARAV